MSRIVAIVFVLLVGCGADPVSRTVSLSAAMSDECRAAVLAGVSYWNERGVALDVVPSNGAVVVSQADVLPDGAVGLTIVKPGHVTRIELERCDGAIGVQNAAHELGHSLGLVQHHPDRRNLMFAGTWDGSNRALDATQLATVGGIEE